MLALVLVDLGGTEAQAGAIRAIVGLGAAVGFLLSAQADRIGRRRLLLITIVGYTACAALTALSPNLAFLTGAQFLSQISLASEWAVAITIVTEEFPRKERGRALGIVTSMNTLGGIAVGLLAFGFSVLPFDVSWRAYYVLALVPLVIVAIGRRSMLETERYDAVRSSEGFARLNHTGLLEPWKPAFRSDVLAVGLVTFLRHAVRRGGRVLVGLLRPTGGRDVDLHLRALPRRGRCLGRGWVHSGRPADGSTRTQAGLPRVHGGHARVRNMVVPDPRSRVDASRALPRDLLRPRIRRRDLGLRHRAVPDVRAESRGGLVQERVRDPGWHRRAARGRALGDHVSGPIGSIGDAMSLTTVALIAPTIWIAWRFVPETKDANLIAMDEAVTA